MIDRRRFMQTTVLAGTALALGPAACAPRREQDKAAGSDPAGAPFELAEVTVEQLQKGMGSGQQTARSITESYLKRIDAVDKRGPELRAIIETNPEALDIADQLDAERKRSGPRGPLHGIPVA